MDERVEDLLKTEEYSPSNICNFGEAVVDGTTPEQEARFKELFENRDFEALGRFVWNQSITYWESIATEVACDQLAKCSFPYEERQMLDKYRRLRYAGCSRSLALWFAWHSFLTKFLRRFK